MVRLEALRVERNAQNLRLRDLEDVVNRIKMSLDRLAATYGRDAPVENPCMHIHSLYALIL